MGCLLRRGRAGLVVLPPGYDTPNASSWIVHIPGSSRNEVHMAVEDGLTGHCAGVDPNIETGNPWVTVQETPSTLVQQTLDSVPFRLSQVEVVGNMAARDCEEMAVRHRTAILDQDRQWILGNGRPA